MSKQLESELERIKAERDMWLSKAGANGKFYMDALYELSAKDKVLEWYANCMCNGQSPSCPCQSARSILSQYAKEEKK